MAKIVNMVSSTDEDMKDYHKKIRRHRIAIFLKYVLLAAVLVFALSAFRYYRDNRSFSGYSVISAKERNDTVTTKYAPFGENILKYSRDGISCTDALNSLLFSITYTMQEPMLSLSERTGAVADKNGSQIYVFDQTQQTGQIKTLLPIKHLAVSNQGVVAVLLEESNSAKLEVYSSDGKLLGDGEFNLEDAGYPMNLSISSDGTKIAIAFAQIAGAKLSSCVAVYNFDNVGENYIDHLVFAKNYTDYMIPEIHYFDSGTFTAVGDGILAFYAGNQIPELVKEITFEEKLQSVFYGTGQVGLVFDNEEGNVLKLYDTKGTLLSEISFALDYENIRIGEKHLCIYNDTELGVYSLGGKECFHQNFESSVVEIFPTKSRNKYLFIYTNETQLIKLQ